MPALFFGVACAHGQESPGGGDVAAGAGGEAGEGGHGAVGGTGIAGGTGGTSVIVDGGTGGDCALTNSCTPGTMCGNSVLEDSAEECDDGNVQSSDGCSRECRVEAGWICPIAGAACQAAACGDGILAGLELCDDGNMADGDGCSKDCGFEAGYDCVSPGALCVPTQCGNALREGSEPCDDGNFDMGDGCTPLCELEPDCSQGACSSHCGDGIKFSDEPCDDGNVRDGDGCSSLCEIEPGFSCVDVAAAEDPLTLPIVYRDFQGGPLRTSCGTSTSIKACIDTPGCHPDFEQFKSCGGEEHGIVQALLGADGKPRHVAGSRPETVNGDAGISIDYFDLWYRDAPEYNRTVLGELTFVDIDPDPQRAVYRYENQSFFPLDGQGWGNTPGQAHNYHFTSEVRTWFEYRGGEQLDFFGDDDLFVFVNKRLAVDLGGVHGQLAGSLILHQAHGTGLVCDHLAPNCATRRTVQFGLELGKIYEIAVFQAERHTAGSHYQLTLSNFNGTRSECDPVCGDGIVTRNEACDDGVNDGSYGTCNADCSRAPFCGDGVLHEPQEQCDDGNYRNGDGCSASCNEENVK